MLLTFECSLFTKNLCSYMLGRSIIGPYSVVEALFIYILDFFFSRLQILHALPVFQFYPLSQYRMRACK
jgi:hypothetical protein